MPKNQNTNAKKARAAQRDGAKYTEALRGGRSVDFAAPGPEGWRPNLNLPAIVAVLRDRNNDGRLDEVVVFDHDGYRLDELVVPHVSTEEMRRLYAARLGQMTPGSMAYNELADRVELGRPDLLAERLGYKAYDLREGWVQFSDGSWRAPAAPHGFSHSVTAIKDKAAGGVRLVVTKLPEEVVLDVVVPGVSTKRAGGDGDVLSRALAGHGYVVKNNLWWELYDGRLYALARPGALAERGWWTLARVRVLRQVEAGSPEGEPRTFKVGEELQMNQHGRAGRPVDRDVWWSNLDIDAAKILDAKDVEVVEVLEDFPPTWEAAALGAQAVAEMLAPYHPGAAEAAEAWAAAGLHLSHGHGGLEIRVPGKPWRIVGKVGRDYWKGNIHSKPYEVVLGEYSTVRLDALPLDPVAEVAARKGEGR
jgi:hypothetical protein